MVAVSEEEKTLLTASRKVTLVAKRFGDAQGKAAQAWVEEVVKKRDDADASALMEMQTALFEECTLDDETNRCKQLSEAIDTLTAAVEQRKMTQAAQMDIFTKASSGAVSVQVAAARVRTAAAKFGPAQKEAGDAWVKKATGSTATSGLLEEQVMMFGECVLSEDGSSSDCEELSEALAELQQAIEMCDD
jgi:hypothetical protein